MKPAAALPFDEMLDPDGGVRPAYAGYSAWYGEQENAWLRRQG